MQILSRLSGVLLSHAARDLRRVDRQAPAHRLKVLADIAGGLLADEDPDMVLRRVMGADTDLGADICMSYQVDPAAQRLRLTYSAGLDDPAMEPIRRQMTDIPFGTTLCGLVAAQRVVVTVTDIDSSEDPVQSVARGLGFRAYAGFPLRGQGNDGPLLGVLAFGSRTRPHFEADDLAFFETIAHHVATVRERLRADAALRESERQFRTLADSIPQLAWMARPDGWVEWVNQRWTDYTGVSLEEAAGWGWRRTHHPDHAGRVVDGIERSIRTGEPWEDTFPLRSRTGEWRWFLGRAVPVNDQEGRVISWLGTSTDVTEQRAAADMLRRGHEEAEAASRSKTRFLAAASHDLRQPIQSMFLLTAALARHVAPEGRETLMHLERGMDALKDLLDGLLDMARLEATTAGLELVSFPLRDAMDQMKGSFSPIATGKGLDWRVGGCDGSLPVRSHPGLLSRLLGNLVENAVRYTDTGHIEISSRREGDRVLVTVADSGIGIPVEHLERIWEEFHQVGNAERDRESGFGLGLAIVRRLSELLGIEVRVTSTPGTGSSFTVILPAGEPAAADVTADVPRQAPAGSADEGPGEGRRVLLIDDDAIVLLGLQATFKAWGYDVLIAASRTQALERLAKADWRPDLIVSDYRLRAGELGSDAVAAVRGVCGADIPGIILSGETSAECAQDAHDQGLGLIHKPVTPRQLSRAMAEVLGPSAVGTTDPGRSVHLR